MPSPADIANAIKKIVVEEAKAELKAFMDAKFQEFVNQMMIGEQQPAEEVQVVDVAAVSDDEEERTRWTEEDWRQIAICFKEEISPRAAHRLFPHLKERSIGCKYREFKYIETNGAEGLHGSASSREKARATLESIRVLWRPNKQREIHEW